jgi:hypothetical protein
LGIEASRIKVVKIVAGSIILDYLIVEDPKIAAAPIAEATFNTSNNVDRETAAMLATLPPDQQAEYLAAFAAAVQQSAAGSTGSDPSTDPAQNSGTGGTANGTNAGNSTGSSAAAAAAAAAELLAVFETLKGSIADGTMERNTGYQTLDLSATVM